MTIKVEIAAVPDTAILSALHKASFPSGWDAAAIAKLLSIPGTKAFIAEDESGFALLRGIGDEAEILTLAVHPDHRRRKVATHLVAALSAYARAQGIKAMFLEVGEHNAPARLLYEKAGFAPVSRRKGYYRKSATETEDAVVMHRKS